MVRDLDMRRVAQRFELGVLNSFPVITPWNNGYKLANQPLDDTICGCRLPPSSGNTPVPSEKRVRRYNLKPPSCRTHR
eukprot:m.43083 g.43083  ORF g.43083 m.43083 type:complete len:78 (-) comp12909_c0_seq33:698-931(-)